MEKAENNRLLMERVQAIEAYMEHERRRKALEVQAIKAQRIEFFKERAAKLDPPLSVEALNLLPKYLLAIEIQKLPSDRSWRELRPKLEADRSKAEERLRIEAEEKKNHVSRQGSEAPSEYSEKVLRRKDFKTPEQLFILELAEKVIAELGEMVASGKLAHVDFIPFVFRRVYDAYQQVPAKCKPVDTDGKPYRLLMDDARMIHKEKIIHFITRWDSSKCKAAIQLKCPGCKRKEGCRRHSFEDLIYHILTHTTRVGSLSYFRSQPDTPSSIAWCNLEWPVNLPILATHRVVSGEWDPNDGSDPIQAPNVAPIIVRNAFEGRCVVIANEPPRCDFVKNLVHAGSLFQGTNLPGRFMTQVAFKFAVDRHIGTGPEAFVPIKVLHDLPVALLRANVRGLFERFRCHKCVDMDGRDRCGKRFATNAHSLGELTMHYLEAHEHSSWTRNMFYFQPAEDLWEELMKPGMEQAYKVFDSLFPEDGDSPAIIPWGAPNTSPTASIPVGSNEIEPTSVIPKVTTFEMQNRTDRVAEPSPPNLNTSIWNTQERNFDDLIDPELIAQTVIAHALIAQDANTQVASAQASIAQASNAEASNAQASSTEQWNAQLLNVQASNSQQSSARLPSVLASEPQQWAIQEPRGLELNVPDSYTQEPEAQASSAQELAAQLSGEALGVGALGAEALGVDALNLLRSGVQELSAQELGAQIWNWPKSTGPNTEQPDSQNPSNKQWNWRELELAAQGLVAPVLMAPEPNEHEPYGEIFKAPDLNSQEEDALGPTGNELNAEDSEIGNLEPMLAPEDFEMIDVPMDNGEVREDFNLESVGGCEELPSRDDCPEDRSTNGAEPQQSFPEPESIQPAPAPTEGLVSEPIDSRWKCVGWDPNSLWGNPPSDMIY